MMSLKLTALAFISLVAMILPVRGAENGEIYGTVVDQSTGELLERVLVVVQGTELQAVTDSQGYYRIEGISPGQHTIQVSTIGSRLLKKKLQIDPGDSREVIFYLGQEASTISEIVRVTAPLFEEMEKAAASQVDLNSTEVKNLATVLMDDPLRSVQTLPTVAAGDDFSASYSVRGGGFQNNGLIVDGVLTHNLVHTIQGTQDTTGSFSALNGDMIESMALYSGAYAAKYGDRTASMLDVVIREGSRDRNYSRLAVSASNAAFVSEGPLGGDKRGSWIASARKSYADYLVRRIGPESDLGLGFADAQTKLAYNFSDRQRVGVSLNWGRTDLSRNPENRGVTSLIKAVNNVGLANLYWIWVPSPKLLLENRFYFIRETYSTRNKDHQVLGNGHYEETGVRTDLSFEMSRQHRLEAGTLVRFLNDSMLFRRYNYKLAQFLDFDSVHGRYGKQAIYLQDRWSLVEGRLAAVFGVRTERSGLTDQWVTNPRAFLEWHVGQNDKIDAGWGIFNQFPESQAVLGRNGNPGLRAEVSRHYVLGYERLLGEKMRVRLEVYDKEESNLPRSRDDQFRLANGKITAPDVNFHYDNSLRGFCRGFEVFLQRRSANRLSGWVSYGFQSSKRQDLVTGEIYPSDFEQSHTINIYGSYRFSESLNLSLKARFGSGFPYPGYFEAVGTDFYLSTERNRERLPYYERIDLRLNKAFYYTRKKLSLYVEVLNALNRKNIRFDQISSVNSATRKISYSKDTLFPILPTAGFVLEF